MRLLLGLILPLLIILAPLMVLVLIGRSKRKPDRTEFGLVAAGCFLFGLFVPILAMFLSVQGLTYHLGPNDSKCATGAATFVFFGYLINFIGIPITAIVLFPRRQSL